MVDQLNIGVNANLQQFIKKMSDADRMLQRREQRLNQLRDKVRQTESRIQAIRAQARSIAIGAGRQVGTIALTALINSGIEESGMETGGFFGRLAIGVGVGATFGGGIPGAVVAGLTVTVAELTSVVQKLAEQVDKAEEFAKGVEGQIKATQQDFKVQDANNKKAIAKLADDIRENSEKETKELLYQTAMAQIRARRQ